MKVYEYGTENAKTMLMFQCSAEPSWIFFPAAEEMAKDFHVFFAAADGHNPEEKSTFESVEKYVDDAVSYKKKIPMLVSYVVFSFGCTGPVLPMWFMQKQYIANLQARGKSAEYIDAMFKNMTTGTFFICVAAIIILGTIGGLFGQAMLKKHFKKAGIV